MEYYGLSYGLLLITIIWNHFVSLATPAVVREPRGLAGLSPLSFSDAGARNVFEPPHLENPKSTDTISKFAE